jgi:catechol 2,3-dioxygenase-like lactoylglutathione lyase family enzyme
VSDKPTLGRIVETAVYVDDLARSRSFYVDLLGAEVLLDTERLLALSVNKESVLLLFHRGATTKPLETPGGTVPPHGGTGIQHFAFAIALIDVPKWVDHLTRSEIAIESRVTWPRGGESIYFRDPDGHSVELITPGLWAIY